MRAQANAARDAHILGLHSPVASFHDRVGRHPLDDNPGYRTYVLSRLLRAHFLQLTSRVGPHVYPEQWILMNELAAAGSVSQADLQRHPLQDRPSLTRMLKTLESRGWIKRKRSPSDRRMFEVSLTKRGQTIYQRIIDVSSGIRAELFSGVTPEMLQTFLETTRIMERNVLRAMGRS